MSSALWVTSEAFDIWSNLIRETTTYQNQDRVSASWMFSQKTSYQLCRRHFTSAWCLTDLLPVSSHRPPDLGVISWISTSHLNRPSCLDPPIQTEIFRLQDKLRRRSVFISLREQEPVSPPGPLDLGLHRDCFSMEPRQRFFHLHLHLLFIFHGAAKAGDRTFTRIFCIRIHASGTLITHTQEVQAPHPIWSMKDAGWTFQ